MGLNSEYGFTRADKLLENSTSKNVIQYYSANYAGKTRGKHVNCPSCGSRMKRIYMKFQYCKKATFKAVGWVCLSCYKVKLE